MITTTGTHGTQGQLFPYVNAASTSLNPSANASSWFRNNTTDPLQITLNKQLGFKVIKRGHASLGPAGYNALPTAGDTNIEIDTRVPVNNLEGTIYLKFNRYFRFYDDENVGSTATVGLTDNNLTLGGFTNDLIGGKNQLYFYAYLCDPMNLVTTNYIGGLMLSGTNYWYDC